MDKRVVASVLVGAVTSLLLPLTARADLPPSGQSVCTPDVRVCFNEYASTPDSQGGWTIRANINDSFPTFGSSAWRRAILIFHYEWDSDARKFTPRLVAQAPWCVAITNCVVEWHTSDPNWKTLTIWWGSTYDNHNKSLISKVGYPTEPSE